MARDKEECERDLAVMEVEFDHIKKRVDELGGVCKECLIRKAVIWLIAVVGVAVVGAVMTLILKK